MLSIYWLGKSCELNESVGNAHFLSQSIAIINILLSQFRNGFHGNVYIHISTIGAMYTASTPHNSELYYHLLVFCSLFIPGLLLREYNCPYFCI